MSSDYVGLPFTPMRRVYDRALISLLKCTRESLPIVRVMDGWKLADSVVVEWQRVEACLNIIINNFHQNLYHLDHVPFPHPAHLGYKRVHSTEQQARTMAMLSRDAFWPHIGMCSYEIFRHVKHMGKRDAWLDFLRDTLEVPPAWVELLGASVIQDPCPRVGGIIGVDMVKDPVIRNMVQFLLDTNSPVYIDWGRSRIKKDSVHVLIQPLYPSENEILCVTRASNPSPPPPPPPPPLYFPAPDGPPVQGPPKLIKRPYQYPSSRQFEGETMAQFFARREKDNAEYRQRHPADSKESQSYYQWLKEAEKFPHPGKKSSVTVWEWVTAAEAPHYEIADPNFIVRTYVPKGSVEDAWDRYRPSQMRYDALYNEWDLYEDFAFAVDPAFNDVWEEPEIDPMVPIQPEPLPLPEAVFGPLQAEVDPFPDVVDDDLFTNVDLIYLEFPNVMSRLTHWHGYYEDISLQPGGYTAIDCARLVGETTENMLALNPDVVVKVRAFLNAILSIPPHHAWPLQQYRANLTQAAQEFLDNTRLIHFVAASRSQELYILPVSTYEWHLAVHDPSVVVFIARNNLPYDHSKTLVYELYRWGIPFKTLLPSPPNLNTIIPIVPPIVPVIGYRRFQHEWVRDDYTAYVLLRRDYLRNYPACARVATMQGGILWRLSVPWVDFEEVYRGPSNHVFTHNYGTRYVAQDNRVYWDDELSEAEESLLCGVLKVGTDTFGQMSDMSWWPKQSHWTLTAWYRAGHWCPAAEAWYQRRLAAICDGTARPLSAAHWNHQMRNLDKQNRKIATLMQGCSVKWLS